MAAAEGTELSDLQTNLNIADDDDKRAKKALLLETIANRCGSASSSPRNEILRQIHAAISSDDGSERWNRRPPIRKSFAICL